MLMNRGYSKDFSLLTRHSGQHALITEVRYPNGTVRQIGYDDENQPVRLINVDGVTSNRVAGTNNWTTSTGEAWVGTVDVIQPNTADAVAGTIIIRKFEDAFLVCESRFFPIGIAVQSQYSRHRTEVERKVELLNGRKLRFLREEGQELWFRQGEGRRPDIVHLPANPFDYALPWRYPAVAQAIL